MSCTHGHPTCPHCAAHGWDQASCTHGFPPCPHCAAHQLPGTKPAPAKCMFHTTRTRNCPSCVFVGCTHGWTGPGCLMCGD